MMKCHICKNELLKDENCFGVPLDHYICCPCFELLSPFKRREKIERGLEPVTRGKRTPEWEAYLKKYEMKP
jgi:hypothetical protein